MITSSDLIAYVNGSERPEFGDASDNGNAYADQCVAEATAIVSSIAIKDTAPALLVDRATLEVAATLYGRKGSGNSNSSGLAFEAASGVGRSTFDPRAAAIKLLRKWVLPF